MTTYNWNISQLDCKPQEDGLTDVVVVAHWQLTGEQTSGGELYSAQVYGTASFTLDTTKSYTPYEDLTKEQVLDWVWQSVDKDATEAAVASQIEAQINPPIISPALPWSAA